MIVPGVKVPARTLDHKEIQSSADLNIWHVLYVTVFMLSSVNFFFQAGS